MKTMKTFATVLALIGLLSLVLAVKFLDGAQANPPKNRAPYTIVWRASVHFDDGRSVEAFTETRYVSSNDMWRSVKVFPDGSQEESFAEKGRGVFRLDQNEKIMYRLGPYRHSANPEKMRHSSRFSNTEQLLGYSAYLLKHRDGEADVQAFYAPELNGDLIKQVVRKGVSTMVLEPISITPGEPAVEQLQHTEYPRVKTIPGNKTAQFSHRVRKQ